MARSKAKIKNWKIINCVYIYMYQTLFTAKNEGKLFLVPKSSGPLLAGLPLKLAEVLREGSPSDLLSSNDLAASSSTTLYADLIRLKDFVSAFPRS